MLSATYNISAPSPIQNLPTSSTFEDCPGLDFLLVNQLPWNRFTEIAAVQEHSRGGNFGQSSAAREILRIFSSDQLDHMLLPHSQSVIKIRSTNLRYLPRTPFLPSLRHISQFTSCSTDSNAISTQFSCFDVVKRIFGLISNSLEHSNAKTSVIELVIKHDQAHEALRVLLTSQNPITIAFAEKLIMPAIGSGWIALVKTLLESGLDAAKNYLYHDYLEPMSILGTALWEADEDMVKLVLSYYPSAAGSGVATAPAHNPASAASVSHSFCLPRLRIM